MKALLDKIIKEEYTRHGGAFDRGAADSYYHRLPDPHYYEDATGSSEKITELTPEERTAYQAGYDYNEECGDKKEW